MTQGDASRCSLGSAYKCAHVHWCPRLEIVWGSRVVPRRSLAGKTSNTTNLRCWLRAVMKLSEICTPLYALSGPASTPLPFPLILLQTFFKTGMIFARPRGLNIHSWSWDLIFRSPLPPSLLSLLLFDHATLSIPFVTLSQFPFLSHTTIQDSS